MKKYINNLLMVLFCSTVFTCESGSGYRIYDDVVVTIENVYHDCVIERSMLAYVDYTVENTGNRPIEYWKIYIRIHMADGPSQTVVRRARQFIPPGDISKTLTIKESILFHQRPVGAVVHLFEIKD